MQYDYATLCLKPFFSRLQSSRVQEPFKILPGLTTCSLPSNYTGLLTVPWVLCISCLLPFDHALSPVVTPCLPCLWLFPHFPPFFPSFLARLTWNFTPTIDVSVSSTRWVACWGFEGRQAAHLVGYILSELLVSLALSSRSANIAEKQMNDGTS